MFIVEHRGLGRWLLAPVAAATPYLWDECLRQRQQLVLKGHAELATGRWRLLGDGALGSGETLFYWALEIVGAYSKQNLADGQQIWDLPSHMTHRYSFKSSLAMNWSELQRRYEIAREQLWRDGVAISTWWALEIETQVDEAGEITLDCALVYYRPGWHELIAKHSHE